eukprot:TRINITY_DN3343_c0_g5_i1.p1 TRINITY_DN3343_c0_g5~~TRINITY_DN3343_c0_g5_i1.p1  ORF type:complete len:262 (+),score=39.40 TRINITY_DN3343_c0_g5_i1:64-849(+)
MWPPYWAAVLLLAVRVAASGDCADSGAYQCVSSSEVFACAVTYGFNKAGRKKACGCVMLGAVCGSLLGGCYDETREECMQLLSYGVDCDEGLCDPILQNETTFMEVNVTFDAPPASGPVDAAVAAFLVNIPKPSLSYTLMNTLLSIRITVPAGDLWNPSSTVFMVKRFEEIYTDSWFSSLGATGSVVKTGVDAELARQPAPSVLCSYDQLTMTCTTGRFRTCYTAFGEGDTNACSCLPLYMNCFGSVESSCYAQTKDVVQL